MEKFHIALTTRWNAERHTRGEDMIEEILETGFDRVELGYDTSLDLVPGVQEMVRRNEVNVESVHNYCPVPIVTQRGHPEIFTLADPDSRVRELAVKHTSRTIRFAAGIGARIVVTHCGNVRMPRYSRSLVDLCEQGQRFTPEYEKTKLKLLSTREKKSRRQLQYLYQGLEQLLPVLIENNMVLAMENLPDWEAIPVETEMEQIIRDFSSQHIKYWHDIGHAQIRENLGLINHERWLERLHSDMAGMHIHDVMPPRQDHLMPSEGKIEFPRLKRFGTLNIVRVIEPTPETTREDIQRGHRYINEVWGKGK